MTVAKEISKHKIHLVGVQEVKRDRGSTEPAGEYTFLYGKGNDNHELGTGFFPFPFFLFIYFIFYFARENHISSEESRVC
jgi:hypothetical protein